MQARTKGGGGEKKFLPLSEILDKQNKIPQRFYFDEISNSQIVERGEAPFVFQFTNSSLHSSHSLLQCTIKMLGEGNNTGILLCM